MGNRKIPEDRVKKDVISFATTKKQREIIEKTAFKLNKSTSTFVREIILEKCKEMEA